MVQKALRWIIHGDRLTVSGLCEAISIHDEDNTRNPEALVEEEDVLLHCSSLIRRTPAGHYLEAAHFTVKEFLSGLSTNPDSPFAPYAQSEDYAFPLLAKTCLVYIQFKDFRGEVVDNFTDWKKQSQLYPFRLEAVSFWVEYAENYWEDDRVRNNVHDLFNSSKSSSFLSWARDYVYVCTSSYWDSEVLIEEYQEAAFDAVTKAICKGELSSLHIAAMIGADELCRWLLESGHEVDQMSNIGTAAHLALLGTYRMSCLLNAEEWFTAELEFMRSGREAVLSLLLERGANPTLPCRIFWKRIFVRSISTLCVYGRRIPSSSCHVSKFRRAIGSGSPGGHKKDI